MQGKQNLCGINISGRLLGEKKKYPKRWKIKKKRLRKTTLDKESCEQPADLRFKKESGSIDVHTK